MTDPPFRQGRKGLAGIIVTAAQVEKALTTVDLPSEFTPGVAGPSTVLEIRSR